MADSAGEKTEQPTAKKLRDAREKGNVFKSQEVITTAILLGGLVAVVVIGARVPEIFEKAMIIVSQNASQNYNVVVYDFMRFLIVELSIAAGLAFGATVVLTLASHLGQFGLIFAPSKLAEGGQKLNVVSNAAQMFSKKSLVTLLFNVLKVLILVAVGFWTFHSEIAAPSQIYACQNNIQCGMDTVVDIVFKFFVISILTMVPVAVLDWLIQHKFYIDDMKMTKDEVQREFKESEGSPELKGERRAIHQEMLSDNAAAPTKQASVVVKNPTHYAVAIRYQPDVTPLPLIVAKGAGHQALKILELAEREDVPVLENVPLARGLHGACEQWDYVPNEFVEPVAKVVRWLYANRPDKVF